MPVRAGALALPRLTACAILSLEVFVVGKFAARLTIPHDLSHPAPVTRCFCSGAAKASGANEAFARELQMRIASAEVQPGASTSYTYQA